MIRKLGRAASFVFWLCVFYKGFFYICDQPGATRLAVCEMAMPFIVLFVSSSKRK